MRDQRNDSVVEAEPLMTDFEVPPPPMTLKERVFGLLGHPRAPLVAGACLVVLACGFALTRLAPGVIPMGRPAIVVFDPVRFINAQRAVASILSVNPNSEQALVLSRVGKQAEAVIREEAHGAVVLVKQAVVAPDEYLDITNAVLERFNMPTDVPTISVKVGSALEDVAPTDLAFSAGKLREDYRIELQQRAGQLRDEATVADRQTNLTP